MLLSSKRAVPAALLVLVVACGGGSGGDGTTPPPSAGPPAAVAVTLPTTLTLGDSTRATASVRDASGKELSGVTVSWRSSATNILSVNATTGVVKALALDTASVIATVTGASASPSGAAQTRVRPPMAFTVSMLPQTFVPVSFVLGVGGVVTFDFPAGIQHNVIFPKRANGQPVVTGAPADILPTSNVKVTRQFNTAGTYTYDCTIHPGMTGEVIVVP